MAATGVFDGPIGIITAAIMARANRAAEEEAIAELAPRPGDDVLVAGFGPGVGLRLMAERITSGRIAGIDPSEVMRKQARRRNRAAVDSGRIELRQGTADDLPWPGGTFDAVLTVNTIQLWRPFDASVREVARVLRPGGRLISYTHDWAIRRSSGLDVDDWAAQAAALCRQCGLAEPRWWRAKADRGSSIAFVACR
jgi:SAM-dependent methyltransferase